MMSQETYEVVSLGAYYFSMMCFWWTSRRGVDPKLEVWRQTLVAKYFGYRMGMLDSMVRW
jgi:hypothetical protein